MPQTPIDRDICIYIYFIYFRDEVCSIIQGYIFIIFLLSSIAADTEKTMTIVGHYGQTDCGMYTE